MSKFPTEQQLTAYVLGELPEPERLRVDEAVHNDASLAAEVERLRKTAGYLRGSLRKDPELKLSPDRRAALEAALRKRRPSGEGMAAWLGSFFRPYVVGPVAVAALILMVVWQGGVPKATSPVAEKAYDVMQAEPQAIPPKAEPAARAVPPATAVPAAEAPAKQLSAPRLAKDVVAGGAAPQVAEVPAAPAPVVAEEARREAPASQERAAAGTLALPAVKAESASPAEAKIAASAPAPLPPARTRAGAYEIEVRLPPALGSTLDAEQIARRMAARLAAEAPAKAKKAEREAGAANETAPHEAKDVGRLSILQGSAEAKGQICVITVSVLDRDANAPSAIKRRLVTCTFEDLAKAFEDLAAEVAQPAPAKEAK